MPRHASSSASQPSARACGSDAASSSSSCGPTGSRRSAATSISSAATPSRAARKRFSSSTSGECQLQRRQIPCSTSSRATDWTSAASAAVSATVVWASMIRTSTVPNRGCGPHVPPQEGRLGERVAADQQVDRLDVVLVVGERARDSDPREGLEERRARGGEARVAALPEGRVRRQREQQRQVAAQAVGQPRPRPRGRRTPTWT